MILDEMADDESVTSASQALRRCLAELSLDNATEQAIAEIVFHQVTKSGVEFSAQSIDVRTNEKFHLLRHQPVQMIHAAKHLVRALAELRGADLLVKPLPRALIREVASAVKQSSALAQKLTDL